MNISGITHVGVVVSNLEESVKFFKEILGLKLISEPDDPEEPDLEEAKGIGLDYAWTRFCVFEVGPGDILELMEFKEPKSNIDKPVGRADLGQHHVSFTVDNINEWTDKFDKENIEYFYRPVTCGPGIFDGIKWIYFKGPDDIVFELMEKPKGFKKF